MDTSSHSDNVKVELPVLCELPKHEDAIEESFVTEVDINVVEDESNEYQCIRSFLEYLIIKVLSDDPKIREKV